MTWEFTNDKERKWQCFVCGKSHYDFESFKDHIRHSHEEGREFVICPLERCMAPVRDLRAHFKAKHPYDKLPAVRQTRAVIWKDVSLKDGKKAKTKAPKFREGHLISQKNGGAEMHYRSGLECKVYEILEAMPEVAAYEVEPISIPYLFEGSQHHYFPDLRIRFSDGRIAVWEIKPANQTDIPKNDAKWSAAEVYCKTRGWEFMVLTERGVDKLKAKVRREKAEKRKTHE